MPKARAAVLRQTSTPMSIESIDVGPVAPGDVLVRIRAASLCHTDLEAIEGALAVKLPANTFGGYPTQYFSTAYNAGYGEWGLASAAHRDQGILSYQFMISEGQSGPYSWWESQQFPNPGSPWAGIHPEAGNGSAPHAWGIANANLVLLDSLAAQRADGALVVGRGVPDSWLRSGQLIRLAHLPTVAGRHLGLVIRGHGGTVTLAPSVRTVVVTLHRPAR